MRPSQFLSVALLLLGVAACGGAPANPGTSIDEGYTSLNAGKYNDAISSFQVALKDMAKDDARYVEAKFGEIRAQCYVNAKKAKEDLLELAKGANLKAGDFSMAVTDLVDHAQSVAASSKQAASDAISEATAILQAGQETFPDYDKWDQLLKRVGRQAEQFGNPDTMAALRGLGYVGGDEVDDEGDDASDDGVN